jgi:hypothetical protein
MEIFKASLTLFYSSIERKENHEIELFYEFILLSIYDF